MATDQKKSEAWRKQLTGAMGEQIAETWRKRLTEGRRAQLDEAKLSIVRDEMLAGQSPLERRRMRNEQAFQRDHRRLARPRLGVNPCGIGG